MDPITLAALGLPALYKLYKGYEQGQQAEKLQVRDTTPAAFKELEQATRQGTAAILPGYGAAVDGINAGANSTLDAATKAGTSGASVLGLLTTADANRQRALADLNTRNDAYHAQQENKLTGVLGQKAAYQAKDQQQYDQAKGALQEASQRNLYGAVDGASQIATYGLHQKSSAKSGEYGLNSDLIKTAGNKATAAPGIDASGPDDILPARRKAINRFGVPDYGLQWG